MRKRKRLRNVLLAAAAIGFFISGALVILSRPETIRYVIATATARSPLKIEFSEFSWNPFTNRITVAGVHIIHTKNDKELRVGKLDVKYRPWDIVRGKFVIGSIEIDGVKLSLPASELPKEKGSFRFNITRLLFLQNMVIKHGIVRGVDISLPRDVTVAADELRFALVPSLLGDTKLKLRLDGAAVSRGEKSIASTASFDLEASTSISRWMDSFPYLNDLKGDIDVTDARIEALAIDRIDAGLKFYDDKLSLDPFTVTIKGNSLAGRLAANTEDESFDATIEIKKPISLPYIGKRIETFDTAGDLAGSVKISGKGFIPSESSGRAEASFAHRFTISPAIPVVATARAAWDSGVIRITDGRASAGTDTAICDGSIDIGKKKISLKASGKNFPIEQFFEKFRNPHFHPIFGRSDFTLTFDGWAKDFALKVKGTTHDGGYKPMSASTVETDIDATYDRMNFKWRIIEGARETGRADLVMRMGKKVGDAPRPKDIDLKATLENHPLATTLAAFGLSGTGNGSITLKGSYLNFTGRADAVITSGKWFGLAFDTARSTLDISRRRITFRDVALEVTKLKPVIFKEPLVMDMTEGSFRLAGNPLPGLSLDLGYQYAGKRWQIRKIAFSDPETSSDLNISGGLSSGGGMDLRAEGSADLKVLAPIGFLVRDASGPANMKVAASGTASNPSVNGTIELKGVALSPRFVHLPLENVKGKIVFAGRTIRFEDVNGMIEDGGFGLKGSVTHNNFKLSSADLLLDGKDMRFRTDDGSFKAEFDGKVSLDGSFPQPLLSGDVTILDGKYTKDFNILETITKPKTDIRRAKAEITFDPRLDLRIRNSGDLFIRNNVGEIGLRADLLVTGTRRSPKIAGAIEAVEGRIDYLGMGFDVTRGFMEFRESSTDPYMELVAQKEIDTYNVTVEVHGYTDNLALDLSATSPSGPLEKKDVISLIAFGMTEMERQQATTHAGQQFGVTMAAQQFTHVVERPISKFAHLDTFKLEAADPNSAAISRVKVGKQLTDRVSVDFATDINTQDATQTVTGEYLVTDNIVLKGSRSSDGRYELDGAIRFRLR